MNKQDFIRDAAKRGAVHWTSHAMDEAEVKNINPIAVEKALAENAEIIEDYGEYPPDVPRDPDCLVLCWLPEPRPIHVVVALRFRKNSILIVTVYDPQRRKWEWSDDYKRRL